ncbi:MAG: sensor histidine kinase [Chromatiales bacterium]|nr:sensor histidine kinase [Chromatiales bacterium]
MTHSIQKIRPAARLLRTIGQDLIKDVYAAIVELVKNAYDADSPSVVIGFNYQEPANRLLIMVEDCGHGMDFDTVVNQWLVPATDDKLRRKRSTGGRVLQGRKGIGRFAAAILGDRIFMETTKCGVTTSLLLDMEALEKLQYLDQLELDIEEAHTGAPDGTRIEIESDGMTADEVAEVWTPRQLHKLFVELRSLIAPEEVYTAAERQGYKVDHDHFEIQLVFESFPAENYNHRSIKIRPYPVLDLYDYKISGRVDEAGNGVLRFENQNIPSLGVEKFELKLPIDSAAGQKYPGEIFIDLRVYDRDPESIENIIKRGLKDPDTGEYVGKQEARHILNEHYGVGIYREQFRIRPYGEQSFDWLDLDKKRVQNPSYKIGHNQIIGFVYVRPEEQSGLQEKSARDGLVENGAYFGLVTLVLRVINELEGRRVRYREKAFKGGRFRSLEEEMDLLFNFESTKKRIASGLNELGISPAQMEGVELVVDEALELERLNKAGFVRQIRDTIAVYQGQATLGKITHVLLHEGRKHIKYLTETVPRLVKWTREVIETSDMGVLEKIDDRSDKVLSHAKGLSFLFKKIEPLARTRRSPSKEVSLVRELDNAFAIFSSELESASIQYSVSLKGSTPVVSANEMDIMTVFANLIENSVFWLSQVKEGVRRIDVLVLKENGQSIVEFKDTGPGFQGGNLELMFEPGYSMKPEGTGLGLALVGEAMSRIGGKIEAKHSDEGAVFELIFEATKND